MTFAGVSTTFVVLVDVVLDNSSPHHGKGGGNETKSDLLDGSEFYTGFAESGIDQDVADRNEDNERKGIELRHNLRWYTMMLHSIGLRCQIVVDLIVADPVEGVPEEDGARHEASAHFIHPGIVKGHPLRTGSGIHIAWLDVFPKSAIVHVLVSGNGVD